MGNKQKKSPLKERAETKSSVPKGMSYRANSCTNISILRSICYLSLNIPKG